MKNHTSPVKILRQQTIPGLAACLLLTGCMHYNEKSGRKTEFNSTTGKFETSDFVSAGFTTQKTEPASPSESDFKKATADDHVESR
jgi:hypothetical protein